MLHSYDWSESSLIVELLTRELGRVAVVAKGAKRPYSQLRAVLLPFQRLAVGFGRGAGGGDGEAAPEIFNLRAAEWNAGDAGVSAPISVLRGEALWSGFYLNELLLKLLARQDPHPRLFDGYAATLPLLAAGDEGAAQAALRAFELLLLREIGVLPSLGEEAATLQPLQPEARYALRAEHGLVKAAMQSEGALPSAQWLVLQAALAGTDMTALQRACAQGGAALRAAEMRCDALFKGTSVDGVYDSDPKKNTQAKRYDTVSYDKVLADNLKVMDASAVALCRDNSIPIVVFSIREKGNLARVLEGRGVQTIVQKEG